MGETDKTGTANRIQWHDAFVAAMKLELKDYAYGLEFHPEYELTGRPKYIDLLIIKQKNIIDSTFSDSSIINMFEKYNVIEYKGVGDVIDMDTLANGLAYTFMYKAERTGPKIPVRDFEDMTLTFVREAKPKKLFGQLEDMTCSVEKISDGVYNINMITLFPVRVIVTGEIEFERHPWLAALTKKLDERHAGILVELEGKMSTDWEHNNAEEFMNVAITANRDVFERIRGGSDMCKAMWELMKPEIDAYVAEKVKKIAEQEQEIAKQEQEIAEQEQEIARLNKIISELTFG